MTPSQFHAAFQNGSITLQKGFFIGSTATESVYLPEAEGRALLDTYGAGDEKQLASDMASSAEGPIKTGVHGTVRKYVEKIGELSKANDPLQDHEIYQSVDVSLLDDPDATPEDKAYVKDILVRKIKANQYAKEHQDQLTVEQKADADLLANTALDEIDYAGPAVLEEIAAEGDAKTKQAVLVFTQEVYSGERTGEVNTIDEDGKAAFAKVAYKVLQNDDVQEIDPQIASSSYEALLIYYESHSKAASDPEIDLPDLKEKHLLTAASATDGRDGGVASAGQDPVDPATSADLVDPVALTAESLKEQSNMAAIGEDELDESRVVGSPAATHDDDTGSIESPVVANAGPADVSGSVADSEHDPVLQYADFILANSHSPLSQDFSFAMRALSGGIADYLSLENRQSNRASVLEPLTSLAIQEGARQAVLSESGALQVFSGTATAVMRRAEDSALDQVRLRKTSQRLNQSYFTTPALCSTEGGLCLWQGEIQDADATTIAGLIATDPNVGGLSGMQSATISASQFARAHSPVTVASLKGQADLHVQKTNQQANAGDHKGKGEDRERRDDHDQEDSHHAWYEPAEEEAETKAA